MEDDTVGYLEVQIAGADQFETQDQIDIHGNEPFYLGRNPALCKRHWLDPTISNKHLRIHCILYDTSGAEGIPPLVYATDVSSNGTFLKKKNAVCASSQTDRGVPMTRKHGAFLLDDGDELRISDSVTLIYHAIEPVSDLSLTGIQEQEVQQFASKYLVTHRQLGKGGFGKVVVGIHQKSQRQLACKIINLRGLYVGDTVPSLRLPTSEETQQSIANTTAKRWPSKVTRSSREFKILKDLSHPNIIQVEKVMCSPSTIYILSELITGGDLFSYMERKGALPSIDAAVIVRQILKAVDYLHDREIVHRDLKPDNILLTYPEAGARIVLTDFGNARHLPKPTYGNMSRRMYTNAGTLEYVAPEIQGVNKTMPAKSGYTEAVDMWSIGVIAANLLSGGQIFYASRSEPDHVKAIHARSAKCDLSEIDDPGHPAWSNVRESAKDFVKKLLVLRIDHRMNAKQALAHAWFANKHLAAEFEALYERSVRDWQPRRKVSKFVEPIDLPPSDNGYTVESRSRHFQQASIEAAFREVQKRFTGSQGWDLSVRYPPSEGKSATAKYKDAGFEGPSHYDQYSFELGTQPGYEEPHGVDNAPKSQSSLAHDPPASGMYANYETDLNNYEQQDEKGLSQEAGFQSRPALQEFLEPQVLVRESSAPDADYSSPTDSPIPYPPVTQQTPDDDDQQRVPSLTSEGSIIYETPLRDSQLQDLSRYDDVFGAVQAVGAADEYAHAQKRRKLAQEYA